MADSFTPRNRGRKPESGQHANAWAALANEDLISDRQDEALDGICAFALSGTKTLTSVNGETDEARMRIINVTGGTGGTVTIPAVEKWYLVRNGSTGALIISNGSNTVTLATGDISAVFTNGTTIYASNNKTYVDAAILAAALSTSVPVVPADAGKFLSNNGTTTAWAALTSANITDALGYTPTQINAVLAAYAAGATPTAAFLSLADDPTVGAMRNTLGVAIGNDVQAYSAALALYAAISPSANVQTLLGAANYAAFRTSLGLVVGTNVQAYSAVLAAYAAGASPTAAFLSLADDADVAAMRATLGLSAGGFSLKFGGNGAVITVGEYIDVETLFSGTFTGNRIFADQSGSIVFDVWKDTYANYPPTIADKITASAPPTISSATKSQDTALTGWTTAFSAGDIIRFQVASVTSITQATLSMAFTR